MTYDEFDFAIRLIELLGGGIVSAGVWIAVTPSKGEIENEIEHEIEPEPEAA